MSYVVNESLLLTLGINWLITIFNLISQKFMNEDKSILICINNLNLIINLYLRRTGAPAENTVINGPYTITEAKAS